MQKKYPFKFLDAYTRDDIDFYFGRDEEIALMYNMIFQTNLLLVYGGSGVGKSSLIQCGLASRFNTHDWQSIFVRRGNNINQTLNEALIEAGGDISENDELDWLNQDWSSSEGASAAVPQKSTLIKRIEAIHLSKFKPIYLVFDQFEELFIFGTEEERQQFYQSIKELLSLEQYVKVILLIREEYLGYLYDFERFVPQLLRKKIRIEPMNLEKVTDIVMGLSQSENTLITIKKGEERQFAEQVFDRIKGGENRINIDLPYLQVFFDKLYLNITHDETRTTPAEFSLESLKSIGDIGDVLRNMLDEQVAQIMTKYSLTSDEVWKFLSVFVSLEGTKEQKSYLEIRDLYANTTLIPVRQLLNDFVNRRILRKSKNDLIYEIAHDSLAKQISLKRSDDEIAVLEIKRMIHSMVSLNENSREYFTEKQLAYITPLLDRLQLDKAETEWIKKSTRHVQELHKAEEEARNLELLKTKRRLRGAIAMLLVVLVAFVFAGIQTFKASRSKMKSEILLADNQRSMGLFLLSRGDSANIFKAQEIFENITKNLVSRAEDFGYLGTCNFLLGDKENALKNFNQCLKTAERGKRKEDKFDLDLKNPIYSKEQSISEAHRLLAHYYYEAKDYEHAYEHAKQAADIYPDDYDAWMDACHYALLISHYQECLSDARQAMKIRPNQLEAVRFQALAYALCDSLQQAENLYNRYFNTIFIGTSPTFTKNPLLIYDTTWLFSTPMFFEDLRVMKRIHSDAKNLAVVEQFLENKQNEFLSSIEMVDVEGGQYTMGNPNDANATPHQVILSDFAIAKYEVTQKLWETIMGSNPSFCKGDSLPVENVTWYDAATFIERLNQVTRMNFRLPTEAEWEYAAMGGKHTHHYAFSGFNDIKGKANYKSKTVADIRHPVRVGSYSPNELGIYDMCGNVWEWCDDWFGVYNDTYQPKSENDKWDPDIPLVNPTGKIDFDEYDDKVLRGGSFDSESGRCMVKNRHHHHPGIKGNFYGIRLAASKSFQSDTQ